jgi:5-methylcytosine-specific restriction enzyme A
MARTPPEWIGKTDDAKVPPRVRLRVFEAAGGICHISGRKIQTGEAWELEHKTALILGGEHRESNLAPALVAPHKEKTKAEMKVKGKIARTRKKHVGITRPKQSIRSAPFARPDKPARVQKPSPPRRPLYQEIE